jgi:hypothetical protein
MSSPSPGATSRLPGQFFWLSAVLTRELAAFRKLAQAYGRMTDAELASALSQGDLQELFP